MNTPIYTEEQRFTQWWFLLPLGIYFSAMAVLTVYSGYREHILNDPWGGPDNADGGTFSVFLVHLVISFLILLLVRSIKMTTEVRQDGVFVRYMPFHLFKGVLISKADIAAQEPVTYRPIREYGGWGIRRGWGRNKKCYNVSGNQGVLLTYPNGGTLLIGSRQPQMLSQAIGSIMG